MKNLAIAMSCLVGLSVVAPGYALAAKKGGQAVVSASGNIVRSDSNVQRAKLAAQGVYYVFFDNSIRKCAAVAAASSHDKNALGPSSVTFWTRPKGNNKSAIEVFAYENETNSAINTEFSLIVQC